MSDRLISYYTELGLTARVPAELTSDEISAIEEGRREGTTVGLHNGDETQSTRPLHLVLFCCRSDRLLRIPISHVIVWGRGRVCFPIFFSQTSVRDFKLLLYPSYVFENDKCVVDSMQLAIPSSLFPYSKQVV